ncbi:hypothetical protein [Rhodococcus sp. OK302]|uniref:hypothetical protein n=1 Tax=Rhodococcus sp. OK302 TaxID=1882769 RepID=UPI001595CC6D|nr:hypothetical protein [Rhodococcus sp. OK302]
MVVDVLCLFAQDRAVDDSSGERCRSVSDVEHAVCVWACEYCHPFDAVVAFLAAFASSRVVVAAVVAAFAH